MERETISTTFPLGSTLPAFSLKNVDGQLVSDSYLRGGVGSLVLFTCNHCPYVKGSDEQMIQLIREFAPKGVKTVAISSNDASQYPDDSFEKMKEKAATLNLPYPYLYDETQVVAKKFDAACTPEAYLFDAKGTLVFHGTINDSPRDKSKATKEHLRRALTQICEGKKVDPSFVHPIGCSIKWKQ